MQDAVDAFLHEHCRVVGDLVVDAFRKRRLELLEDFPNPLRAVEREQILKLLRESGGNKSLTARRLGIERKTLYEKAKRLGISFNQ